MESRLSKISRSATPSNYSSRPNSTRIDPTNTSAMREFTQSALLTMAKNQSLDVDEKDKKDRKSGNRVPIIVKSEGENETIVKNKEMEVEKVKHEKGVKRVKDTNKDEKETKKKDKNAKSWLQSSHCRFVNRDPCLLSSNPL